MDGYEKLSEFMGTRPGMAIVRRFSALGMRNVLFLQAELAVLEALWEKMMAGDSGPGKYERNSVYSMKKENSNKWLTVLETRKLLKEYYDAVLQQAQIYKLEGTNETDLCALHEFQRDPKGVGHFFRGLEETPWNDKNIPDLMALSSRHSEKDWLTGWISETLLRWLHTRFLHRFKERIDEEVPLYDYPDKKLVATADIISIVVSCLLPTLSIVVLYYVHRPSAKLGVIVGFTTLFSLALAILTKCRRIEVFAATAAFSAIQVVFVGSSVSLMAAPTSG